MILTILAENFNRNIMRLAENERSEVWSISRIIPEANGLKATIGEVGLMRLANSEPSWKRTKWSLKRKANYPRSEAT